MQASLNRHGQTNPCREMLTFLNRQCCFVIEGSIRFRVRLVIYFEYSPCAQKCFRTKDVYSVSEDWSSYGNVFRTKRFSCSLIANYSQLGGTYLCLCSRIYDLVGGSVEVSESLSATINWMPPVNLWCDGTRLKVRVWQQYCKMSYLWNV